MTICDAADANVWDAFLSRQQYRPFLQSFTMGEVYAEIGQPAIRLVAEENGVIHGICFAHVVDAKRGKHLSAPYGPVSDPSLYGAFVKELKKRATQFGCAFIRMSPFIPTFPYSHIPGSVSSPLHLLAEHVWYLPLKGRTEEQILMEMRKTTRNLIRRAEKDGVYVKASTNPNEDLAHFIRLHDETRKRHGFTPYTNKFFEAQVRHFAAKGMCTVYLAHYQNEVIAASIHMHAFGETSYHHGASSYAHSKVPASYLLQWTAIKDSMKRGDHLYNFWGIAPESAKHHPFAGVTLFKTGFGGQLLNLEHCRDIPVSWKYWLTYAFETARKWRRGF